MSRVHMCVRACVCVRVRVCARGAGHVQAYVRSGEPTLMGRAVRMGVKSQERGAQPADCCYLG